jgi:hypothetical protein
MNTKKDNLSRPGLESSLKSSLDLHSRKSTNFLEFWKNSLKVTVLNGLLKPNNEAISSLDHQIVTDALWILSARSSKN